MRLSIGSAAALGFIRMRMEVAPTTCYIMLGSGCRNSCAFCSQSKSESLLSRVSWVQLPEADVITRVNRSSVSRVCLQCTGISLQEALTTARRITKPVSICHGFGNKKEIELASFADRICIPIDAASEAVYRKTKGAGYKNKLDLLFEAAGAYPGRITTHLIIGIGESENNARKAIELFNSMGVKVGLFAFTPVKGTSMQSAKQPKIGMYRRMQALNFMLSGKTRRIEPEAFQTTGCPGCNRPYYNEGPLGRIYNFPRPLSQAEYRGCMDELKAY